MKRWGRIALGVAALIFVGAALFFFLPARLDPVQASPRQSTGTALVERGRYLATAADSALWTPPPLAVAATEGWTFGVPYRKDMTVPA